MRPVLRRLANSAVLVITLAASSTNASADPVTIDFGAAPASFTTYTEAGVTFSALDGRLVNTSVVPHGSIGIISSTGPESPYVALKATSAAQFEFVSVSLGDFGGDADMLFLEAFNSMDALVASTSLLLSAGIIGNGTLQLTSLSGADVRYVVFGSRAPSLNGSSVFADNFRFETADPIPEPTSMLLLGTGLLGLGMRRWRQKRT